MRRVSRAAGALLTLGVVAYVIIRDGELNRRTIQHASFWVRADIAAQRAAYEAVHGDIEKANAIEAEIMAEADRLAAGKY